jgi:hypothetical protein
LSRCPNGQAVRCQILFAPASAGHSCLVRACDAVYFEQLGNDPARSASRRPRSSRGLKELRRLRAAVTTNRCGTRSRTRERCCLHCAAFLQTRPSTVIVEAEVVEVGAQSNVHA